jgi:hypothetical protein
MKIASRWISAVTVTALAVAMGTVPTNAVPRTGAYDGEWSVVIQTLRVSPAVAYCRPTRAMTRAALLHRMVQSG